MEAAGSRRPRPRPRELRPEPGARPTERVTARRIGAPPTAGNPPRRPRRPASTRSESRSRRRTVGSRLRTGSTAGGSRAPRGRRQYQPPLGPSTRDRAREPPGATDRVRSRPQGIPLRGRALAPGSRTRGRAGGHSHRIPPPKVSRGGRGNAPTLESFAPPPPRSKGNLEPRGNVVDGPAQRA